MIKNYIFSCAEATDVRHFEVLKNVTIETKKYMYKCSCQEQGEGGGGRGGSGAGVWGGGGDLLQFEIQGFLAMSKITLGAKLAHGTHTLFFLLF